MSLACVDYVPALCTHRPSLLPIEWLSEAFGRGGRKVFVEIGQTWSFRGSKSRNKVSVGEPAEGSLQIRDEGEVEVGEVGVWMCNCTPCALPRSTRRSPNHIHACAV